MTKFYQFSRFYQFAGLMAALLLGAGAHAGPIHVESVPPEGIQVEGVWTLSTLPGQDMAMVYMSITSKQAATIIGVSSKASKTAEMHHMEHKKDIKGNMMMTMEQVKSISLPANQRLEMSMHGYHLVLAGLKAQLKDGATVPLTLNIEMADKSIVKVDVKAEVRPLKK